MSRRLMIVATLACIAVAVQGQSDATTVEWPTYGGDLGNTRYSAVQQINSGNFSTLEVAWRFKTDNLVGTPGIQVPVDAADGQRPVVFNRRHAPSRGGAGRRDRGTALDA